MIREVAESKTYPIKNAGLVLLNNYLPQLFEKVGLVSAGEFYIDADRVRAAHYLQYLVAGNTQVTKSTGRVNKILCGLNVESPLLPGVELTEDNVAILNGLLEAAIAHWPAIGSSSVEGFRGDWLIRDGQLAEFSEKWELTIEKRAYDLLLNQSPYSFSIIRYPWMAKPLYVEWAY